MPDLYAPLRRLSFSVLGPALGIELARFKHRKNEWQGYCPVHDSEGNNCFSYNETGKYHCFSCEAKGSGAIDLVMAIKGIGFKEAVSLLQPLFTVKPTNEPSTEKSPVIGDSGVSGELKPFTGKYEKFAVPCPWLEARIPDKEVRERYGVFCYNNPARKSAFSGRVMIPIRDIGGTLYGYLGRSIAENSSDTKYLFPTALPKSRFLFGAHELNTFGQLPLRVVYLVESPFCVMKFASLGLPALSPFGWSISAEQLLLLKHLTRGVVYLPDRNKYQESTSHIGEVAQSLWVRFPPLPAGIDDPEQMTKEQVLALTH